MIIKQAKSHLDENKKASQKRLQKTVVHILNIVLIKY